MTWVSMIAHTIAIWQMEPLRVTAGLHVDGELQLGVLCLQTEQCMVQVVIISDLVVAVDLDAENLRQWLVYLVIVK